MSSMIVIIEDEKDLAATLEYNLQKEGYFTRIAFNGKDGLDAIQKDPPPDLVLLDLMLPDIAGTEVCRQVRALERGRRIPVIILTAKGEEIDRVVGFEVGADDYVVKPFSVRELMLRIRAVLRRAQQAEIEVIDATFGRLKIDTAGHHIWVDGKEIFLTALEFRLLTTFVARKGRVQTRDMLLQDVWGINSEIMTRTVDAHIKRLREKLGPAGDYIETIRGVGYRFRATPDERSDL